MGRTVLTHAVVLKYYYKCTKYRIYGTDNKIDAAAPMMYQYRHVGYTMKLEKSMSWGKYNWQVINYNAMLDELNIDRWNEQNFAVYSISGVKYFLHKIALPQKKLTKVPTEWWDLAESLKDKKALINPTS